MTANKKINFENSPSYYCCIVVYRLTGYTVQNKRWSKKMKRRIVSYVIVMMVCFVIAGNTLALSSDEIVIQPRSAISVTCGLTQSGSLYRLWSKTKTSFSDELTASASLYQIVNGSEVFITSVSASATGTTVTASKLRSLSSGTYKVYGYGTAGSSSGSKSITVTIP